MLILPSFPTNKSTKVIKKKKKKSTKVMYIQKVSIKDNTIIEFYRIGTQTVHTAENLKRL